MPRVALPLLTVLCLGALVPVAAGTVAVPTNGLRGYVLTEEGQVITGAVEVGLIDPRFIYTTVNETGAFTLYGHHGLQNVQAWARGYAPVSALVEVPTDTFGWHNFTLPYIGASSIHGNVTTEAGRPLLDAVFLPLAPKGHAVSDHTGSYRLDLWAGSWELLVVADGFESARASFDIAPEQARSLDITLVPLASQLRLQVLDLPSGQPLVGASVHLTAGKPCRAYPVVERCQANYHGFPTGEDGRLVRDLWAEMLTLEVCAQGYAGHTEDRFVQGTLDLVVRLEPQEGAWCEAPGDGTAPRPTQPTHPPVPPPTMDPRETPSVSVAGGGPAREAPSEQVDADKPLALEQDSETASSEEESAGDAPGGAAPQAGASAPAARNVPAVPLLLVVAVLAGVALAASRR